MEPKNRKIVEMLTHNGNTQFSPFDANDNSGGPPVTGGPILPRGGFPSFCLPTLFA